MLIATPGPPRCAREKVVSEHGNHLKLTCYEEDNGGKLRIGEGSTKVVETGQAGAWVPITDDRKVGRLGRSSDERLSRYLLL